MKWALLFSAIFFIGCGPKAVKQVESTPIPQEETAPAEPTKAVEVPATPKEVVKVQDLLNKILGNKVFFDFDKSTITEEGKQILAEVGAILVNSEIGKKISVEISGHTDDVGTEDYNMALGEQRAKSVMEYLVSYGVQPTRLQITTFGEEKPAVEGTGTEARKENRRAEFKATASIR